MPIDHHSVLGISIGVHPWDDARWSSGANSWRNPCYSRTRMPRAVVGYYCQASSGYRQGTSETPLEEVPGPRRYMSGKKVSTRKIDRVASTELLRQEVHSNSLMGRVWLTDDSGGLSADCLHSMFVCGCGMFLALPGGR